MPETAATFEDHLSREIIHSERLRMGILAGLSALLLVFFSLMYALFRESFVLRFLTPGVYRYIVGLFAFLLCYELAIRQLIGRWQEQGRSIPAALRYVNAFIETSIPSIAILLVWREISPVYVLQSAASFLYAIFIVLSTLRMDFRLSVFTGLVAAAEYVALSFAYVGAQHAGAADPAGGTPFEVMPYYLAKGALLAVAGLAAGFVAHQIKRRIGNAYRSLQERERMLNAFGQQVSPAIADELIKSGGALASKRGQVCILFMDIRNFTPLVEHKPPEEIVAFQNAVFGEAIEVVNRNHGIINQFLGDGFMATFGAPVSAGNDCRNALRAAMELVSGIRALGELGRIPAITIGVGLHAGEAVSGNIGSELRQQYSITGNVVILAARIEQLNKEYGSQILASREVLEAAGEPVGTAVPLGPVRVKGREQPIELFRLA